MFKIGKRPIDVAIEDIKTILRYAHDLPTLENKFRDLANIVLYLEIRKKELSAQLLDLHVINQYQIGIDNKKEQLMKLTHTSRKHHGKSNGQSFGSDEIGFRISDH